jgi:predicted TIM-barrel fold metal-dependent hydrolase
VGAIDADAHVIECEATFDYIDDAHRELKPRVFIDKDESNLRPGSSDNLQREYWVVDGRIHAKQLNMDTRIAQESREVTDVSARLAHMDELGINVQVLYPTLFLRPWTQDPLVEYVLCKAYNRWLAEVWRQAPERLRWVVMPPLLSPDKLREELTFAKENGAVGVFLRGIECERRLDNPWFYPLYALGEELDLPMCFHAGNNSFSHQAIYGDELGVGRNKLPVVAACESLLLKGVPARFPKLRWGFLEVYAQWVPYVLKDLRVRAERKGERLSDTVFADNNIFVACQLSDDIAYLLDYAGAGQLVIGTDYGHADSATEIEAMRKLRADGALPPEVVDGILETNPRALYGL